MRNRAIAGTLLVLVILITSTLIYDFSARPDAHATPAWPATLNGCANQEDRLWASSNFNQSGVLFDAAIQAAEQRCIILGIPTDIVTTQDWSGNGIEYGTFTSGLHAEWHANNIVRIYNAANQLLFTT